MTRLFRFLAMHLAVVAACCGATVAGGTAAILVRTPSRVLVAVDSKEVYRTSQDGKMRVAETCAHKLRRIGNYVAVVAGFSRGSSGYDALEFMESKSKPGDRMDNLIRIAEGDLSIRFRSLLRELSASGMNVDSFHKPGEPAIQIGLIGAEEGVTKMAIVQLFVDDPSGNAPLRVTSARCPGDCNAATYAFLLGTHAEMNAALAASPKMMKNMTRESLKGLVALETAAHPEIVGGPTATAVIAASGEVSYDLGQCGSSITESKVEKPTVGDASLTGPAGAVSIDSVRELLTEQLSHMTDLQCHRTIHRYVTTPSKTKYVDDVDFDIELHTGGETYSNIKRKNKQYRDIHDLPGSWYSGDLATVLSVTSNALLQSSDIRHRNSDSVATFHVPAQDHQWYMMVEGKKHWMDIAGAVTVVNGVISGIEWTGTRLPLSTGIHQIKLKVTFGGASIAEKDFRVPESSVFAVEYEDAMIGTALDVSGFSNFRRLGSTSTLSFE